jgi:hypothetical protein
MFFGDRGGLLAPPQSEGVEQTVYSIVRSKDGPQGLTEFVEPIPEEGLEGFRGAMRSSDLWQCSLLPLLRTLIAVPYDLQENTAATVLRRPLEVAVGEGPVQPMWWLCWTTCFKTTDGFTCYDCYYGDFCIIGECCSHPYFSRKDKSGPCGGGGLP